MSDWTEHELGEFASIQTGPFGSQLHASDYVPSGVPSIMPKNIGGRLDIVTAEIARIRESDAQRLAKYRVQPTDIVYSRRGDVEKCAFVTDEQDGWLCGTGCIRVRFKSDRVNPKFVALSLSTPDVRGWISSNAVGTIMPNLNTQILQKVPILLPPIEEQKAIADVLTSLDEKIDLLHRQNKTLEAMAETLFRQWFVEEAGEDWEEGNLADIAQNVRDAVPAERIQRESKYIGLEHIGRRSIALLQHGTGSDVGSNKYAFQQNDILFGKLRPYFHKVCIAPFDGVCSTDILVIRAKSSDLVAYCLFAFFQDEVVEYANLGSGGTRMPRTDWHALSQYAIKIPSPDRLSEFNAVVVPAIQKIVRNLKQIHNLENLRDTLLPKLMSGEVRVQYE
ncbi:restriction endonuclease subunit S [Pirellulaceae bacterium SH449]